MKKPMVVVTALVLATGGCTTDAPVTITRTSTVTVEASPPTSTLPTLADLYATCQLDSERGADLGDGGNTLSLELPAYPVETVSLTVDEAVCVATGLEIPSSVTAKINATEYGDPAASGSWENVTLTWKIDERGNVTFIYEMGA